MSTGARVGLTADFRPGAGQGPTSWGDIALGLLEPSGLGWEFLPPFDGPLPAEVASRYDAIIVGSPPVTAASVDGEDPPMLLARFGVGFDSVDLDACTAAGVAVSITPDGARRPVAAAAVTMLLALQHNLLVKDRLVRQGRWSEKSAWHGTGLTGQTVGIVGLGNIGAEVLRLLAPFGVNALASDPACDDARAQSLGARLVDLDELMAHSDAVVLTAALTEQTRHCVNARRLATMRPGSVLVNISRGPLVDTAALVAALDDGPLRGAALDVFEDEPLPADHPLTAREDVVLSPHAIAWTTEMAYGNGASAVRAVTAALTGSVPDFLVDRSVLEHPRWTGHR